MFWIALPHRLLQVAPNPSLALKRPNPYPMVLSGWRSRLPRRVGGAALLERATAADARAARLRTARRARVQV